MLARIPPKPKLVNEILDQLPLTVWTDPTVKFLDPAIGGGQFVSEIERRLRDNGHSESNISERVYGYENNTALINLARNLNKLRGISMVGNYTKFKYNELLNMEDSKLKFDVIVGNPPYQDSTDTGYALWNQIVKVCVEKLLNPNGIIAMVHPPSFIGKQSNKSAGKNDYNYFSNLQIEQLHLFDNVQREKFFPGVGTRVCWYIAKNTEPTTNTTIVGYNNDIVYKFQVNLNNAGMLPTVIDNLSMQIHSKLINSNSLKLNRKRELHYHTMKKKKTVSEVEDNLYPYKSYFSHKIIRYSNFKFSDFDKIKLMIPQTSTVENSFIDVNCNVSEDLFYVICSSLNEATKLQNYMKSDLVKYIGRVYRPGRNLGALLSAGIIPDPGCSINWTNEELEYMRSV